MITSSKCPPRNSAGLFRVTIHPTRSARSRLQHNHFSGRAEYRRAGKHSSEDLLDSAASVRSLVHSGRVEAARWIAVSSSIRKSICGRGWLAVGDSASCYDPLSGRGIFKAIRHGSQAAAALDRFLRGETDALGPYQEHVCREYRDYLIQRTAFYKMEKRWMDSAFWVKRSDAP